MNNKFVRKSRLDSLDVRLRKLQEGINEKQVEMARYTWPRMILVPVKTSAAFASVVLAFFGAVVIKNLEYAELNWSLFRLAAYIGFVIGLIILAMATSALKEKKEKLTLLMLLKDDVEKDIAKLQREEEQDNRTY